MAMFASEKCSPSGAQPTSFFLFSKERLLCLRRFDVSAFAVIINDKVVGILASCRVQRENFFYLGQAPLVHPQKIQLLSKIKVHAGQGLELTVKGWLLEFFVYDQNRAILRWRVWGRNLPAGKAKTVNFGHAFGLFDKSHWVGMGLDKMVEKLLHLVVDKFPREFNKVLIQKLGP